MLNSKETWPWKVLNFSCVCRFYLLIYLYPYIFLYLCFVLHQKILMTNVLITNLTSQDHVFKWWELYFCWVPRRSVSGVGVQWIVMINLMHFTIGLSIMIISIAFPEMDPFHKGFFKDKAEIIIFSKHLWTVFHFCGQYTNLC